MISCQYASAVIMVIAQLPNLALPIMTIVACVCYTVDDISMSGALALNGIQCDLCAVES